MPERVKYKNGIMIEGGNLLGLKQALVQLINNKNLRNEMGRQGEKYVLSELSWDAVAKKFIT